MAIDSLWNEGDRTVDREVVEIQDGSETLTVDLELIPLPPILFKLYIIINLTNIFRSFQRHRSTAICCAVISATLAWG